ncbi:HYR domain-containing protein [Bacteroidia bacterium]|nr:HYR domain-containing protein [Bacteroidia bacterium]
MKLNAIFLLVTSLILNTSLSAQSYDSLVMYLPFNNGNVNDSSSYGNDATSYGPILSSDRFGNPNSAYYFDGIDDYMTLGTINGLLPSSSHTISFWAKTLTSGCESGMVIATDGGPPSSNRALHYGFRTCSYLCPSGNCFDMDFYNTHQVTNSINDTNWIHWTLTYDSASLDRVIYQDGLKFTSSVNLTGVTSRRYIGSLNLQIGALRFSGVPRGSFFKGYLDAIKIFDFALDTAQVYDNFCPSVYTTDTITSCGAYTWTNGVTYTTSNNTATDTFINAAGCDSIVTLNLTVDIIKPTVITQNLTVSLDVSGSGSTTATQVDNGSTDNCTISTKTLSKSSFNCSDVGINIVYLIVTDVNGNVDSAAAVVTVVDTIKPTVLTNNLSIYLNASGAASITTTDINNSSFDNCGISSLSLDITSFDCNDLGANTVVLTATDVNSNSSSATAIVIVLDTISPVILTVPNDITLGYCDALYTYSAPTASDNCSFTIAQIAGLSSGSKFPIGTTTNTFVVTDASGNQDVTSFDVTIIQEYLPFVLSDLSYCGNSTQVNLSQGRDSITFAGIGVGSNAISFEPVIAGVGTHTITATFIDTMGCVTNGTFDIYVLEAPTVPNITRVASDKIYVLQEYESYQWYRNGTIIEGERAQLYRAMELGLYTVLAGNGNKCYEISEGYEFGIPFQEDEVIQQNRVTVYPNPTEGLVFIEFKNGEDTHIVTLTNGLGVELIKVNTDQRVYRLDISNLAAGTYTVNVVSSTINESVQIIKK